MARTNASLTQTRDIDSGSQTGETVHFQTQNHQARAARTEREKDEECVLRAVVPRGRQPGKGSNRARENGQRVNA